MHFKNILRSFKSKDMLKRIGIVLGLIVAYRILAHVPVPLGNPTTFKEAIGNIIKQSDFGNFFNLISGGGLTSFAIIAIGISPYITSSIVVQLITKAIPRLEEMSQDGETSRRKINQWTRLISVPLSVVHSTAYMFIMYKMAVAGSSAVHTEPTTMDWVVSASAMTAGSVILMWIGELMTEQGLGSGISTIIAVSILSQIAKTVFQLSNALFDKSNGTLSLFGLELPVNPNMFIICIALAVITLIGIYLLVKLNEARRVITINYAKRVHGNSDYGGIKSILPIKLIAAGVVPVIFATAILSLPAMAGQIIKTVNPNNSTGDILISMFTAPSASNFSSRFPNGITAEWFFYPSLYFLLVVLFTYFYTSIIFNTKEIADNLQKQGGFIEKVRPGLATSEYLERVVTRLNFFGALSLGLISVVPFILDYASIMLFQKPLGLSLTGTGLLIVITVALENLRQLDSRALMSTYDNYKQ